MDLNYLKIFLLNITDVEENNSKEITTKIIHAGMAFPALCQNTSPEAACSYCNAKDMQVNINSFMLQHDSKVSDKISQVYKIT